MYTFLFGDMAFEISSAPRAFAPVPEMVWTDEIYQAISDSTSQKYALLRRGLAEMEIPCQKLVLRICLRTSPKQQI